MAVPSESSGEEYYVSESRAVPVPQKKQKLSPSSPPSTTAQNESEHEEDSSDGEEETEKKPEEKEKDFEEEEEEDEVMPVNKNTPSSSASAFSKVFCDADEIALLQGLSDFWAAHGKNSTDWVKFHLFVKDRLSKHFTKTQVSEKIRRLRLNFLNKINKARPRPLDHHPHQSLLFQLSNLLWGDHTTTTTTTTTISVDNNMEDFQSAFPLLYASFDELNQPKFIRDNFHLVPPEKAQQLEHQLKELKAQQIRLELRKIDLMNRDLLNKLKHHRTK